MTAVKDENYDKKHPVNFWRKMAQNNKNRIKNKPPHDKTNKMASASSEDSDQPGHPHSLISLRCPHEESLGP